MEILRVIARLLDYPVTELQSAQDELLQAVNASPDLGATDRKALQGLIRELCGMPLLDAQEIYVGLFDRGRALSLLLFEHVHGESRDRGQAMVDLMAEYESAGLILDARELPDYLPLFLEYLSTREPDEVLNWLSGITHILALLAERLGQRESHYQVLFDVLLSISGASAELDRQELAVQVAAEARDDTPEALDAVWEEEMVRFLDDQGESCGAVSPARQVEGMVVQRRHQMSQVQPVKLSTDVGSKAATQGALR